jgi:hypothetical protein
VKLAPSRAKKTKIDMNNFLECFAMFIFAEKPPDSREDVGETMNDTTFSVVDDMPSSPSPAQV